MRHPRKAAALTSFLGNFGSDATSTKFERELRDTANNMKASANRRCAEKHW